MEPWRSLHHSLRSPAWVEQGTPSRERRPRFGPATRRSAVYLKMIRKRTDDKCWFCRCSVKMTRSHILHCPNEKLVSAGMGAWDGKNPGGVRVLLANPRWERRLQDSPQGRWPKLSCRSSLSFLYHFVRGTPAPGTCAQRTVEDDGSRFLLLPNRGPAVGSTFPLFVTK